MVLCFVCNGLLDGVRIQISSGKTLHSNVPIAEKIAQLLGEEFVVIVSSNDYLCKQCTSVICCIDKLENDLKFVKNAMLSLIVRKYGILLPDDQAVQSVENNNGNVMIEKNPEQGQKKVPSTQTVRTTPAVTTSIAAMPVQSPLKLLKPQPQQKKKQQQQNHQQIQKQQEMVKIFKCGTCKFQSKELENVRLHMAKNTHSQKTQLKTPQTAAKILNPKKLFYKCQVCAISFESQMKYLYHVIEDHKNQYERSESENSCPVNTNKYPIKEDKKEAYKKDVVMPEKEAVLAETSDSINIEADNDTLKLEDLLNEEYFDIESLLASIQNENSPTNDKNTLNEP